MLSLNSLQIDDTVGFPSTDFEVIAGSLEVTFDQIPVGSNVTHVVVIKPLISGMHNFIPAKVSYKNSAGDELVISI